jgi:hypothetical protein
MMRALLLCLVVAASAHAQAAPRTAGSFKLAVGEILLQGKDGAARPAAVGGKVFEGDSITTQAGAEAHLQMADGASLILRENSRITLAAYVADGGEGDKSLIELARGALRSITGWIGKHNRSNYAIRTPLVTIGVRGTDHEPAHLLEGDARGKPGSYDKVNAGLAVMQSPQGTVEIPANKAAFLSLDGLPPQLLEAIPEFFKPGAYEREFNARARQVERALDELRRGRIDELMRLKDGKLNLPKVPTRDDLRRGLGDFLRR